jgi:hypothetical protein
MLNLFVKIASFAGNLLLGKCSLHRTATKSTCYNPADSPGIDASMHPVETPFPGSRAHSQYPDFFPFRTPAALHEFPAILLRFGHIVYKLKSDLVCLSFMVELSC